MSTTEQSVKKGNGRRRVRVDVPADVRLKMVADAAYYIAQRRGFDGGDPMADWLAAEAQIEDLLMDTVSAGGKRSG